MASKRITLNEKKVTAIRSIFSKGFCLSDVHELEEVTVADGLFVQPPECWDEFEVALCDFLARKQFETFNALMNVLGHPEYLEFEESKSSIEATVAVAQNQSLIKTLGEVRGLLERMNKTHNQSYQVSYTNQALKLLHQINI